MNTNLNSGWGQSMAAALPNAIPGKVFFVGDSGTTNRVELQELFANDVNGTVRFHATIDAAIGSCTANAGDVILVAAGHTETLTATDITCDVAGVSIIGLGSGSNRPTLSMNNASAEISVAASNVTIENIILNADVPTVAIGIEIEDGVNDTVIRNCRFDVVTTGTDEFTAAIHMVNDNARTTIEGNVFEQGIGAAVAAIHMDADTDETVIRDNKVYGDYSTACIVGDTTLSTNVLIDGNLLVNGVGGNINTEPGIELLTGTTGIIQNNNVVCNLTTKAASIVADTVLMFENYYNEDIAGTGGLIGAVSADD